jgi:hypothetical protein
MVRGTLAERTVPLFLMDLMSPPTSPMRDVERAFSSASISGRATPVNVPDERKTDVCHPADNELVRRYIYLDDCVFQAEQQLNKLHQQLANGIIRSSAAAMFEEQQLYDALRNAHEFCVDNQDKWDIHDEPEDRIMLAGDRLQHQIAVDWIGRQLFYESIEKSMIISMRPGEIDEESI